MEHPQGFRDILRRAQAGDQQAFEDVLTILRPWLEQLARGYADAQRPDECASDLAQEARLRVWQKLGQFRGAADDEQTVVMFRAWVGQIVRRVGLNARRDHAARRRKPPGKLRRLDAAPSSEANQPGRVDPPAGGDTPSANAAGAEQIERVREALDRLADATDRAIVRLRFFEGLSLRQIAERLDNNPEKVRLRYHAVLRQLERDLEP
jgi:RNA polymerase sigma factor (sigma-70 family)